MRSEEGTALRFGREAGRRVEVPPSPPLIHIAGGGPAAGTAAEAEKAAAEKRLPHRISFARASSNRIRIAVLKAAEDGRGIVLRLVGSGRLRREGDEAEVEFFRPIRGSARTSIIEDDLEDIPPVEGRLRVQVRPFAIETVRIRI